MRWIAFSKMALGLTLATLAAVAQVNDLLHQHFPASGERANELPDRPIML